MKATPILYIHGANSTSNSFNYISAGLRGWEGVYFEYDINEEDITDIWMRLKSQVQALPYNQKIHIVGHSLGGVLAFNAATVLKDNVRSVTSISAPFGGVEVPFAVKMIHPYNKFIKNLDPSQWVYSNSRKHTEDVPSMCIRTTAGRNTLISESNDGVVTLRTQQNSGAWTTTDVPLNHFESLLHPSVTQIISEFIGNSEDIAYK